MRAALAYRPKRAPLQSASPLAAAVYLGSIATVALVFSSPIVLAGAGVAICLVGLAAQARATLVTAIRYGALLAVVIVVVNLLVTQRGETILLRGWDLPLLGTTDVTLESLVAGAAIALRIIVVMAVFAVWSACVDPDRVLRALRPLARRSALTATLVARLIPLAAADLARLREAGRLRGPAAAPAGRAAIARRLFNGALDRSIDAAATLELRGFGTQGRAAPGQRRRSRYDRAFALTGLAIAVLAVGARVAGLGGFDAYPVLALDAGPLTLGVAGALPALAMAPFAVTAVRMRRRRSGKGGVRLGGPAEVTGD